MVTSFATLVMPQKLLQHSQSHTYKSMSFQVVQVLLVTSHFHYGMSKECLMDAPMHMHMPGLNKLPLLILLSMISYNTKLCHSSRC